MGHHPQTDLYVDIKSVNERLLQLSMRTGYSCIQRNGQRYYGPPPNWTGPPPERGSEVFVGRLPRDCFEDELVPVFETVAMIYEVRMMMNFTGFNRGFAFVTYCNPEDAWKAVLMLNEYEIRPGHKIGISKSTDNCRLYVGGIPLEKNKADAWEEVVKICPTIQDVIMYPNPQDRKKNRGFLFIEFESHRSAAMAKRSLVPGTVKLWGQDVIVDWAVPEPDVDPHIMATITKLFIRNLTSTFNCDNIHRLLNDVIPMSSVQRIYIATHYGFVHFDTRVHAQLAKDKLELVCLDGEMLEVHWARPKCFRKPPTTTWGSRSNIPPRLRRNSHPRLLDLPTQVPAQLVPLLREPDVHRQPQPQPSPLLPQPHVVPPALVPVHPRFLPHAVPQPQPQEDVNNNYVKNEPQAVAVQTVQQQYAFHGYAHSPVVVYSRNPYSFYSQ